MEEIEKILTEAAVSDAVTEKPIKMICAGKEFLIHPPTLGKMQILSKLYLELDIDEKNLEEEPHLEAMRICEANTDTVSKIMAVAVHNDKNDLLDDNKINETAEFFKWNSNPADFGKAILSILTQVNYVNFMNSIRLTKILRQNAVKD